MADWEVVVWQDMREVLAMRFDNRDDATNMRNTLFHMYGADNPNVRILMHYASQHPILRVFHDAVRLGSGIITEDHEGRPIPFIYDTDDPNVAETLPPMDLIPSHWLLQYFEHGVAALTWTSQHGIEVGPVGKYDFRDRIGNEWRSFEVDHEWDSHDETFLIAQLERRIQDKRGRR
jgi:hypothetical protein